MVWRGFGPTTTTETNMAHNRHGRDMTSASSFTPRVLSIVVDRLRESDGPLAKVAQVHRAGMTASDLMLVESWNNVLADRYLKTYEAALGLREPRHDLVTTEAVRALAGVLDTKLHWRARGQVRA